MSNGRFIYLENVRVRYSNFSGARRLSRDGRVMNQEGDRNFTISLTEDQANQLIQEGAYVKKKLGYNDPDDIEYLLKIKVSYKFDAPKIVRVDGGHDIWLDEDLVGQLDNDTIDTVDITIKKGKTWEISNSGMTGVSLYLKSMVVRLVKDPTLERYMANHPTLTEDAPEFAEEIIPF